MATLANQIREAVAEGNKSHYAELLIQAADLLDHKDRPAAPVEGLDTVGYVTTSPTGAEVFQRKPLVPGHGQFGYKQDAVVTRSQAEAIIAALKGRPTEIYQVFLQGSWIDCPKAAFDKYVADGKTTRELVVKGV